VLARPLRCISAAVLLGAPRLLAQTADGTTPRRHFVGSSAFVLANAVLDDAPDFYQLNVGRWLTSRDVVSLEAITWKYDAPLGIPYGPSLDAPSEDYPGYVRGFGIGAAYQRFLWRSLYSGFHALPLRQHYVDENGAGIQNGFQLFLTLRLGYHLKLRRNRFFLEPSVAFTHWPINTNVPAAFAQKDGKWPNYFLFEPGLHFGVKF
jgi:hypothetical protein